MQESLSSESEISRLNSERSGERRSGFYARTSWIRSLSPLRFQILQAFFGALIGLVFVHPVTMSIYWFEFHTDRTGSGTMISDVLYRTFLSFDTTMWIMASIFIVLGAVIGFGSGSLFLALRRKEHLLSLRGQELEQALESLLASGESSRLEFKSSMRWDWKHEKINKSLEQVVVKTIAGFMNHQGGILVLGVSDDGTILGLEKDFSTLKLKNRDGYHQHITHLVTSYIGTDLCHLLSVRFQRKQNEDVCLILISAANHPAYVNSGNLAKYFLRTGNTTRELNTREAVAHIQERF